MSLKNVGEYNIYKQYQEVCEAGEILNILAVKELLTFNGFDVLTISPFI